MDRLHRYVDDVINGRETASKKVQLACQRHLDDLERAKDPACPWTFDPEKAERPMEFMERFLAPTKGNYDHMELMDWQCFIIGSVFGWVEKETGLRRYREALVIVARGNGKSTLMSGLSSYLCSKDGERGADVYLLANTKEQAAIVFDECSAQIMASPKLARHFNPLTHRIEYRRTHSKIEHRASDSKKLDGLNPHAAIFDEIHQFRSFKLLNVIKRGMNKRRQPLAFYITTMGTVLDGPLMQYYTIFSDALLGHLAQGVADRMFCYIAELDENDDVDDYTTWEKANPGLKNGKLLDLDTLRSDWERAKLVPDERSDFITKQLDLFTDAGDASYLDHKTIEGCDGVVDLAMLEGRECYGGFDLSASEDFTAAALVFPLDDGRIFVLTHSWVPQHKVTLDQEKLPYYEYAMRGDLTICPGQYITQDTVFDWFIEQSKHYAIRTIGYDPAGATWLVRMLESKRIVCNPVRQGPITLNAPMKDIREVMLDGRLVFNKNPLFKWYLHNVKLRHNFFDREKENWVPTKRNRYQKIDGFMAFLDGYTEYMRLCPLPGTVQEAKISVYTL